MVPRLSFVRLALLVCSIAAIVTASRLARAESCEAPVGGRSVAARLASGAEGGALTEGLTGDADKSGRSLTEVATVVGLGLSVAVANRPLSTETSLNFHARFEYEVSRELGGQPGSPLGFGYGPSISIGNVGTNQ